MFCLFCSSHVPLPTSSSNYTHTDRKKHFFFLCGPNRWNIFLQKSKTLNHRQWPMSVSLVRGMMFPCLVHFTLWSFFFSLLVRQDDRSLSRVLTSLSLSLSERSNYEFVSLSPLSLFICLLRVTDRKSLHGFYLMLHDSCDLLSLQFVETKETFGPCCFSRYSSCSLPTLKTSLSTQNCNEKETLSRGKQFTDIMRGPVTLSLGFLFFKT